MKGEVSVKYVPIAAILITVFAIDLYFATPHLRALAPAEGLMPIRTVLTSFAGWRAIIDLGLIAFCAGLFCVPLYALVQSKTPASRRARVIAANNIINAIFMTAATILSFALIAAGLSIRTIFLLAGLANALAAAYICKLSAAGTCRLSGTAPLPIALPRRGQGPREFPRSRAARRHRRQSYLDARRPIALGLSARALRLRHQYAYGASAGG